MMLNAPGVSPTSTWARHREPFVHVRAEGVFEQQVYDQLVAQFNQVMENTRLGETQKPVFRPPSKSYDAMICGLTYKSAQSFLPLFDPDWLKALASIAGFDDARIIDGALHHVPQGSRSGYIHTDFCSAWFDRSNEDDIVRFPVRGMTDYFSGVVRSPAARPVEYIRVATMIFYLANDGWTEGDGGETGLFSTASGIGPKALCPPVNNSLLLFECMPHSFHALQGNPGRDRNSIILWLHADVESVLQRWPTGANRRKPS
jgi:hypothetical protein